MRGRRCSRCSNSGSACGIPIIYGCIGFNFLSANHPGNDNSRANFVGRPFIAAADDDSRGIRSVRTVKAATDVKRARARA